MILSSNRGQVYTRSRYGTLKKFNLILYFSFRNFIDFTPPPPVMIGEKEIMKTPKITFRQLKQLARKYKENPNQLLSPKVPTNSTVKIDRPGDSNSSPDDILIKFSLLRYESSTHSCYFAFDLRNTDACFTMEENYYDNDCNPEYAYYKPTDTVPRTLREIKNSTDVNSRSDFKTISPYTWGQYNKTVRYLERLCRKDNIT